MADSPSVQNFREIECMSGLEFERFLAQLFPKLGFTDIRLTSVNDRVASTSAPPIWHPDGDSGKTLEQASG